MIKNPERFFEWPPAGWDGEFVWDFLDPAWAEIPKAGLMDIDATFERNGHLLYFETKMPGKEISAGQKRTLTEAWKRYKTTVVVVYGKCPKTIEAFRFYDEHEYIHGGYEVGDLPLWPGDWRDLLYEVRKWFCRAHEMDEPTREDWDAWMRFR